MTKTRALGTLMAAAAVVLVGAGTASADPVKSQGRGCHGGLVSSFASAEPEGVGNFVGGRNVRGFQQFVREVCEFGFPEPPE